MIWKWVSNEVPAYLMGKNRKADLAAKVRLSDSYRAEAVEAYKEYRNSLKRIFQ
jgi:hypothetical protein